MIDGIIVRSAAADDIAEMSAVLTASITELCAADHSNDPQVIAGWTRNKTPQGVTRMLANPKLSMFVAEVGGVIGAVGAIADGDTVALNYVSPAYRRRGLSRALLAQMEAEMARLGAAVGRLTSTRTALDFYRAHGWRDAGPPEQAFGMPGYPMTKQFGA